MLRHFSPRSLDVSWVLRRGWRILGSKTKSKSALTVAYKEKLSPKLRRVSALCESLQPVHTDASIG